MWLPVRASRTLEYDLQPFINPDSDKNFGSEYNCIRERGTQEERCQESRRTASLLEEF